MPGKTKSSPTSSERRVTPLRKPVKCPNCDNTSSRQTYPFCGNACADDDLGRWFEGAYAIGEETS